MREIDSFSLRGWQVIRLRSDQLQVDVVPGLGATVTSIRRLRDDLELLYSTPWGLPAASAPSLPGSADELRHDLNPGGWQSLFPNGGDNAIVDGVEWGTDGEARIGWFDHEVVDGVLIMTCRLRRAPLSLQKTLRLEAGTLELTERITHHGSRSTEVMWGSRLFFGAPLISTRTEIDCGAAVVHPDTSTSWDLDYDDITPWPRAAGSGSMINLRYLPEPDAQSNRLAYLSEFDDGWLTVTNTDLDCRVRLDWDAECWPHVWYEVENGATHDHPWYGTERYLSLSPNSSWPARGVHDARRVSRSVLSLAPDEERTTALRLSVEGIEPVGAEVIENERGRDPETAGP